MSLLSSIPHDTRTSPGVIPDGALAVRATTRGGSTSAGTTPRCRCRRGWWRVEPSGTHRRGGEPLSRPASLQLEREHRPAVRPLKSACSPLRAGGDSAGRGNRRGPQQDAPRARPPVWRRFRTVGDAQNARVWTPRLSERPRTGRGSSLPAWISGVTRSVRIGIATRHDATHHVAVPT